MPHYYWGGYAFNTKWAKQAATILEGMGFPMDYTWKYDPQYIMSNLRGISNLGQLTMK